MHHLRKSQDETDPLNNLSGTQGIAGAVDTIWVLVKDKRYDNEATLYTTSRDVGQGAFTIRFDQDTCRWEYLGTADEISGQRAQDDYDHDELVMTIKELVTNAPDGTWTGSATDILRAGQAGRRLVGLSPQKVGYRIRDICGNLETYDRISHIAAATNGTGGLRHTFYFLPTPLPTACAPTGRYDPDEDLGNEWPPV